MTRKGFFTQVDGHTVHVQGDPDMPPETFNALERMIRAAIAQYAPDPTPPVVRLRHPVTQDEQLVEGDAANRIMIFKSVGYEVVDDQKE